MCTLGLSTQRTQTSAENAEDGEKEQKGESRRKHGLPMYLAEPFFFSAFSAIPLRSLR
jgi:hypothetical protein